jgi:hypothetical protein
VNTRSDLRIVEEVAVNLDPRRPDLEIQRAFSSNKRTRALLIPVIG